ncbi:MAG: glycosyltransferase family 4 protein [Thermodesulfobacteriota bacterium]
MQGSRIKVLVHTVSLGGVRQHIEDIVTQIDRERFELVGAFPDRLLNRTYLPDDTDGYQDLFAKAGFRTCTVETPTGLSPLACAKALLEMIRLLRREKPDVLHCHSSMAGAVGRLAALARRPRLVLYTPHLMFSLRFTGVRRFVFATLERLLFPLCDGVIAVSASEYAGITRVLGKSPKIRLIRNAVPYLLATQPPRYDTNGLFSELDLPAGKKIILSTARFDAQKDVGTLVRAAALLARTRSDFLILLAGDGEERDRIIDLIQNLGLTDRVRLLGWRSDVPRLVAACDVMVLSSRQEGLPYAMLEALALCKPVVGSDVPGIKDCIDPGRTGFLFPLGDAGGLADALNRLLEDEALREDMGAKAREMALNFFSPQGMIDALESLYAGTPVPGHDPSKTPRSDTTPRRA